MSKVPSISEDELLAALRQAWEVNRDTPGLTTRELKKATKWSIARIMRALHALKEQGILQVGKKSTVGIDGRQTESPCYRIMKPNERP